MDDRGWHLDRQQGGLHLMLSPYHLAGGRPVPRRPRRRGRRARRRAAARRPPTEVWPELPGQHRTAPSSPVAAARRMGRGQGADRGGRRADGEAGGRTRSPTAAPTRCSASAATRTRSRRSASSGCADDHPDEGPLGGFLTALEWADDGYGYWDTVVVSACDHPWLDGETVENLLFGLIKAPLARPATGPDGRAPLFFAANVAEVLPVVTDLFASGERSMRWLGTRLPGGHRAPDRSRPPPRRRHPRRPALRAIATRQAGCSARRGSGGAAMVGA